MSFNKLQLPEIEVGDTVRIVLETGNSIVGVVKQYMNSSKTPDTYIIREPTGRKHRLEATVVSVTLEGIYVEEIKQRE